MRWTRMIRVFLGFLLAPIPVTLFYFSVALLFLGTFGRGKNPNEILPMVPVWTYGISLLIGLPVHMLLQRKGLRGIAHYLFAGVAASAILTCFQVGLAFGLFGLFTIFIMFVHLITLTVILFWLIAVWQPRWPGRTIGTVRVAFLRRVQSRG